MTLDNLDQTRNKSGSNLNNLPILIFVSYRCKHEQTTRRVRAIYPCVLQRLVVCRYNWLCQFDSMFVVAHCQVWTHAVLMCRHIQYKCWSFYCHNTVMHLWLCHGNDGMYLRITPCMYVDVVPNNTVMLYVYDVYMDGCTITGTSGHDLILTFKFTCTSNGST
jgi:hypothetical protein